jgi:hypothetical protein
MILSAVATPAWDSWPTDANRTQPPKCVYSALRPYRNDATSNSIFVGCVFFNIISIRLYCVVLIRQ